MHLKTFQREDLARAALHDGLILGLDTGLGKTICAYIWPLLKVGLLNGSPSHRPLCPAAPVLFLAAGDLHEQIIEEGRKHFGVTPTVLEDQAAFLKLATLSPTGRWTLPPGYYLTTYTALSRNGVLPFPELDKTNPAAMRARYGVTDEDLEDFYAERGSRLERHYRTLDVTPDDPLTTLTSRWFKLRKECSYEWYRSALDTAYYTIKNYAPSAGSRTSAGKPPSFANLSPDQQTAVTLELLELAHKACAENIGESRVYDIPGTNAQFSVKCIYSPSFADHAQDTFDAVVADEGTKIKGEDTLVGKGTRQMNPRFRLVMTATPIKNRLPDVFHLAHWATGARQKAHPRFPFAVTDREEFAEQFCVSERNLSAEEEKGGRRVKLTPQVCNIHRLWKLLCPIVLRRRKEECGEEMVPMVRNVVRVPMGRAQAALYQLHLKADYRDKNDRPAMGAKLQALRIAAANPASSLLDHPPGHDRAKPLPSVSPYIPKLASALNLIRDILQRGEQVIVFSAFHDSLDALSSHLHQAGVRHVVCDGRMSPARRGTAAAQFKRGRAHAGGAATVPVMLAGVECMSEGHSFNRCSNVILMAYSWAFDKFIQAINRIWRLDSIAPVNVYALICEGSIDRVLESSIHEKGDAADLVLDGHLLGENPTEVNLAELLRIAEEEFAQLKAEGTIEEKTLAAEWPALRSELTAAMSAWLIPSAVTAPPLALPKPAPSTVLSAIESSLELWQQAA